MFAALIQNYKKAPDSFIRVDFLDEEVAENIEITDQVCFLKTMKNNLFGFTNVVFFFGRC